jgi:nucleoside-diphosphate-sugar epimerase
LALRRPSTTVSAVEHCASVALTVNEFTRDLAMRDELVVFGEQFWRPYVHVRDAARAIAEVLDAPKEASTGEVYNVGDTRENYREARHRRASARTFPRRQGAVRPSR